MNKEEDLQGTLMTANDVANLLHGNYRTVRKILEDLRITGEVKEGSVIRANRSTIAYYLNNSTIKRINAHLKDIRNRKTTIVDKKQSANDTNVSNNKVIGLVSAGTNAPSDSDTNVKIYEVMRENNELQNKLKELENNYSKEHEKAVKLEADLYKAQSDIKLIEDKRQTVEADNAEKEQKITVLKSEKEELQKNISDKNKIIIALASIIGAIILVSCTVIIMLQFIR